MAIEDNSTKGLQLGQNVVPVNLESNVAQALKDGSDKELWLIQLPIDFELSDASSWRVKTNPDNAVLAQCDVEGATYAMVEDAASMGVPVYLAPTDPSSRAATAVTRRVTISRTTEAPKLCFGIDAHPVDDHLAAEKGNSPAEQTTKTPSNKKRAKSPTEEQETEEKSKKKKSKKDKKKERR